MIGLIARENAHAQGDATRFYGGPRTNNPYPTEAEEHRYWNMGWDERDKELTSNMEP